MNFKLKPFRTGILSGALSLFYCMSSLSLSAQYISKGGNDASAPLHLLKPGYDIPYGETKPEGVKNTLDRIYRYLNTTTPAALVDKSTNKVIDLGQANDNSIFQPGDFRLISYEWGVTYTGMLEVALATGDQKYKDYTIKRLDFIGAVAEQYKKYLRQHKNATTPVRSVLEPHALDDVGSMAAAMIKALDAGAKPALLRPLVDHYLNYILHKEFRLKDGTLARNRPLPNTLWLDDLYMSLPALAQMGKLTGNKSYFDEALKQYKQFAERMFNAEKGLYMHGWVQDMDPHPQFHWARANGWALMTKVELLDVLPADYSSRAEVLEKLRRHAVGLAERQDKTGFWHQLLDRNDSYLETSATAIYAYCIARAINKGWLDAKAYGPMVLLAWNAVNTKVTEQGQIEGTCVGTGMGFDPAFYYYRPISNFAAHGYGPVLLAGAEIYRLLQQHPFEINDSAVQMVK
ncbi:MULTISPECIES: glycoside hydrolase family 88/105 protein [Olivibacter]|uniref:Glycoside hydrolase family 105 protein n=1 Tax=Olivibacter oleidegradans TaxID=760123 RepID=A0ABV6HR46_9SPHI|nr:MULTISPECIES: glycoside hydrolase family 88 protein [unclassified Olivibacter]MDM8174317.1 glycoside hydrolase family 88 protein [Olivibacter sp. 47]QEL04133.1 glycoside hydrolase family 88 protein [Olivibacter sp. LS-1]